MLYPSGLTRANSFPGATFRAATLTALLAAACALPAPGWAQTSVPDGGNIGAVNDPAGINLAATAALFDPAAAPAASYGYLLPGTAWTIASPAAGTVITLNDGGGHYGYFNNTSAAAYTLTLVNPLTITGGNNSAGPGGAIYNNSSGALTIGGNVIFSANAAFSNGGAIYDTGALSISGNASFSSNAASNGSGGAIYSYADNVVIGDYASFDSNTASNGDGGGAIYDTGNNMSIGIYATFTGNEANTSNGGAINTAGNNMTIGEHASFASNKAPNGVGGAIYFYYSGTDNQTIGNDASFTDNAAMSGGALYYDYNNNDKIGDNAALTGNTASNGSGGAIYFYGDALTIGSNATLTGNKASSSGGAIYVNEGSVTIDAASGHTVFKGNTQNTAATPQANAVYLHDGSASLTFNTAAGGAVTLFDPIQNNPAGGLVSVAAQGGGAVAFDGSDYSAPADQWSQLYGNTQVQGGATFAVQNGAVYGALAGDVGQTAPSNFTAGAGTVLAGGGAGTVRADSFTLGGALNIASAAPATVVSGNFSVFNIVSSSAGGVTLGGTVNFNTCLNNGGAQLSDQLNLTTNGGAVTGQTTLVIHPVSSPACQGAATTGDGILLAQADTSAPLFTAAAGDVVVSHFNGYDYVLAQVGNNWYLQSAPLPAPPAAETIPTLETAGLGLLAALLGLTAARRRRR